MLQQHKALHTLHAWQIKHKHPTTSCKAKTLWNASLEHLLWEDHACLLDKKGWKRYVKVDFYMHLTGKTPLWWDFCRDSINTLSEMQTGKEGKRWEHAPHRISFKDICFTRSFVVTLRYLKKKKNCYYIICPKLNFFTKKPKTIVLQYFTKIKIEYIWSKSHVIKDEVLCRLFKTILAD